MQVAERLQLMPFRARDPQQDVPRRRRRFTDNESESPTTCAGLRTTSVGLRMAHAGPRTTSQSPRTAHAGLRTAHAGPRTTSQSPRTAHAGLRTAYAVGGHPKIPPSGQLKIPPSWSKNEGGVRARTGRIRDARRGAKGHRGGGTDWPWDSGSDTRDAVAREVEEGDRAGVGPGHQYGEEVVERGVEAAAPAGTG